MEIYCRGVTVNSCHWQVIEHYGRCIQELGSVERHLLQAKARALTEQEKILSERKQALHGYENISLPSG